MKTIPEMIEILQGFEAGRKVEFWSKPNDFWYEVEDLEMLLACIIDSDEIRLAPEPKLVPYGPEDIMYLRGRWARSKVYKHQKLINMVLPGINPMVGVGGEWMTLSCLFETWEDVTDDPNGVPFGKVVDHA